MQAFESEALTSIIIATVVAGVVTYLTLKIVFDHLNMKHFRYVAWYLLVMGTLTLTLAAFAI
jgi:undecaprenyl pyrophosphate phosphatase UppP